MFDGEQDGGSDGNGTVGDVLMNPLDASHSQLQMEVVCECVLKTQENVQHLDTRKIISDRWWLHGAAKKLSKRAYGVYGRWQRGSRKIDAKPEVAAKLGPQIGISALGKGT